MANAKILIVEDNLLVSSAVQDILLDEGFEAVVADTGKQAEKELAKGDFDLVLLDMMLPDTTGKDLLIKWQKSMPELLVIFLTAHGDIPTAVDCLRAGAHDFLTKPVEKPLLIKTITNALKNISLVKKVEALSELTTKSSDYSQLTDVIATSDEMKQTFDMLKMVSQSDYSCLLIKGESGTGKGLLARSIHKMGGRSDKPFVEVNCSALPANLIESELFGHKKGAFTDAKENKIGLFEMADGGTLFLDEIGDMDFNLQAKLLKVIEEQKFRRIGDTVDINVDVTIVAATNQEVENLIEAEKFRLDLYYRLNVIPINIPPLRDRKTDIPALAEHFIHFFTRKFGKEITGFSDECMSVLMNYTWPGNVREFRNVVERCCILSQPGEVSNAQLLFPGGPSVPAMGGAGGDLEFPPMPLAKAEELAIRAAMKEAKGNKNKAAKTLGVHRTTLYKKIEEYGIEDGSAE